MLFNIEKFLLIAAVIVVLVGIGIIIYFNVQPGSKLYENELYGFKTEYAGTWHESGGDTPKIVSFIGDKNIFKDYAPNTDIYVYFTNKSVDEFLIELENGKEELSRNEIIISGIKGMQTYVLHNYQNVSYKQEYIVVEKFERYYILLSTDLEKNFNSHAKEFDIVKNNFAFTNISPEQFGGIGDLVSELKQKYQSSVPKTATFEWEEGAEIYIVPVDFKADMTLIGPFVTATAPTYVSSVSDFVTENPLTSNAESVKGRTLNCISDAKKQCVELITMVNKGYVVEKRTYLINKTTGLIEKISVSSTAGSFSVVMSYES